MHHQMTGLRYNYSQPFFVHFDVLFGTRISADKFQKMKKLAEQKRASEKASKGNGDSTLSGKDATQRRFVEQSNDPFVTTTKEAYVAKAGSSY